VLACNEALAFRIGGRFTSTSKHHSFGYMQRRLLHARAATKWLELTVLTTNVTSHAHNQHSGFKGLNITNQHINILMTNSRTKFPEFQVQNSVPSNTHFMFCRTSRNQLSFKSQRRISCTKPQYRNLLSHNLFLYSIRAFSSSFIHPKSSSMSTLYDQSIPVMIKYLNNCSKMLDKTVKWADENGKKYEDILTFRLRDDMRP
jgi:Domain of unknown function (DUF1993)